ncbi:MAG: hypothetical protein ACUVUC_13025 [Thermoguttaceae bacterium]
MKGIRKAARPVPFRPESPPPGSSREARAGDQSLWEFFDRKVVPRLAIGQVYRGVRFAQDRGRFRRAPCPFHESNSTPYTMFVDAATLRWSCLEGCRKGGASVLAFLNKGRFPAPGTGQLSAALKQAAALAGLADMAPPTLSPDQEFHAAQQERVASLLETFFLRANLALQEARPGTPWEDAARLARSWLGRQGFDATDLPHLPAGLFPSPDVVRHWLAEAGFTPAEIDASRLATDPRLEGRLVVPIRDCWGRIVSFWARDPGNQPPDLLIKGRWKQEIGLFGLDVAFPEAAHRPEGLVVVERLLEALLLQAKGIPNTAAVGGPIAELTSKRWRHLAGLGLSRITLLVGPQPQAAGGLAGALKGAFRAGLGPLVFVVPLQALGHGAGPGDLLESGGALAVREALCARAVHALVWMARTILDKHRRGCDWTGAGRRAAWNEARQFYAAFAHHAARELDEQFVPAIAAGLGTNWEAFQAKPRATARPAKTPAPPAAQPVGYCPVHRCETTECFCFD